MSQRLNIIYNQIPPCNVFADIGCDHGYITKMMLDGGKCNFAIFADVSKNCLKKAEELLFDYVKNGKALGIVSDGFVNVEKCDCALIAGMGGEEIVKILKSAKDLPEYLVLQPMKNIDKVRVESVKIGYCLVKDFLFKVDKIFYNLLILQKGKDSLKDEEIEFGRTNLLTRSEDFLEYLKIQADKLLSLSKQEGLSDSEKKRMTNKAKRLLKYVNDKRLF